MSLGISASVLNGIDQYRRGEPDVCFSDVFTYWQNHSTPQSPANWATIVEVLRSNTVGEEALSDNIRKKFKCT